VAKTPPPEVPRGELTPAALGLWFTRFRVWAADQAARVLALESVPAAVAAVVSDGTDFSSYRHKAGNSGLSPWNVAGMVAGGGLNTYAAPTLNNFYAVPFLAPKRGGSIVALAWDSNAALGNSRIAVYTNRADDDLYPNALLGESGSKANTGAATIVSTTGLTIGPLTPGGLYWLAIVHDNAGTQLRKVDATSTAGMLGAPLAQVQTNPGIKVAFVFGAPPATFPSGGAYINISSDVVPALGYRVG
jgi:hypothetical protein